MDTDVMIVGAGPIGMTAALDLGNRGIRTLVLDVKGGLCHGSRAIVIDHASLAHFQQLGCVDSMLKKGLVAERRRTYFRGAEIFCNEFPQHSDGGFPRFLNLPQTETESILLEALEQNPFVKVRWNCEATGIIQNNESVRIQVRTPDSEEYLESNYLLACDGCRSSVRKILGLDFPGYTCPSQFLIVDVHAELPETKEHRFHFDHPCNPGRTLLTVPQPNNIWRIDWHLPCTANMENESRPSNLEPRIREVIGDVQFDLVWSSHYRFHQRMMPCMSKGRIFFLGDAAHIMAPFGARGMNSGIQDARNIAWKIDAVSKGIAPLSFLDTYNLERGAENRHHQRITCQTMRFIAPKGPLRRFWRNTVLSMSQKVRMMRSLVDSGKMSDFPLTPAPAVL